MLVKGKIERNSIQGTVEYFKAYAKFLRSKFSKKGEVDDNEDDETTTIEPEAKSNNKLYIIAAVVGVCFVFFIFIWLYRLISHLEQENYELQELVNELQSNRAPPPPLDMQEKMREWVHQLDILVETANKLRDEINPN